MCQTDCVGKRQESREQIEAQIIELGRRHLVDRGAAGLSLRAIARDLSMVSSAVYRYVSSRDELLTLLLIDAYSDLANAVDQARDTADELWSDDVVAIARAARRWAVEHPAQWAPGSLRRPDSFYTSPHSVLFPWPTAEEKKAPSSK